MVRVDRQGNIAIVTFAAPPVNVLGLALREALHHSLNELAADSAVAAIVLVGQGAHFSYGLDLRELDGPIRAPTPSDLASQVETLGKPVVAALRGMCLGAGFELALAATARVAQRGTQIALADLGLGLTPGAGGTQRLPRIVGARAALDLMLHARPQGAARMPALFDQVEAEDAAAAAIEVAQACIAAPRPATRDRNDGFDDPAAYQAEIARRRDKVALSPIPAARDIVAAVEAALLLPFEAGLTMEAEVFADSVASPQSHAQRHVVIAERRAVHMPETRPGAARPITQVAIVGGGVAACGIAGLFLSAGLPVIQFERTPEAVTEAKDRVMKICGDQRGRMERWQGTTALADLGRAQLVIEAVAEVPRTKAQVFAALGQVAGEGTILATQSGLLPIDPIAQASDQPEHVLGLHFHAPIGPARLVEVIPGSQSADWAIASVAALVRGPLGRVVVRAGTGGGTLAEPIMAAARDAGLTMLAQGVPIERIDRVMAQWGLPQGIFRQIDIIGPEVMVNRGRLLAGDGAGGFPAAHLDALDLLVQAGRKGRGAGQGFYRWDEDGHAHADDRLGTVLFGSAPAAYRVEEEEICLRVVAAMANQGARMLRATQALRPSDIDVACVLGAQFPRWRGGPMKAADLLGLFTVQRALERLAGEWPALYDPDPGFAALVRNGENFDALNKTGRNRRSIPG
nr:3-hydroxyacyl-CoA dehydrogenase NAD-binding domain-containing protein [Lutimaribacter sp. EGI FJ00013]